MNGTTMAIAERNVPLSEQAISSFCERHSIVRLGFFGSVLTDEFSEASDVDVIVDFQKGVPVTYFDVAEASGELEAMIGHAVDVVTFRSIESSHNPFIRNSILESVEIYYENA